MTTTNLYRIMTLGSVIGFVAAFWQMLEKLTLLKNADAVLGCNLSGVLSCSNVLSAPQSAVFGFPNSLIGITMFSFFLTTAIIGLAGSKIAKKFLLVAQGLAVFMLCFTLWFLWQSTYAIQSICIFCLFIAVGVLTINFALFRLNSKNLPKQIPAQKMISSGADAFMWLVVALAITGMIAFKFYV